jgi:hypothetical protein
VCRGPSGHAASIVSPSSNLSARCGSAPQPSPSLARFPDPACPRHMGRCAAFPARPAMGPVLRLADGQPPQRLRASPWRHQRQAAGDVVRTGPVIPGARGNMPHVSGAGMPVSAILPPWGRMRPQPLRLASASCPGRRRRDSAPHPQGVSPGGTGCQSPAEDVFRSGVCPSPAACASPSRAPTDAVFAALVRTRRQRNASPGSRQAPGQKKAKFLRKSLPWPISWPPRDGSAAPSASIFPVVIRAPPVDCSPGEAPMRLCGDPATGAALRGTFPWPLTGPLRIPSLPRRPAPQAAWAAGRRTSSPWRSSVRETARAARRAACPFRSWAPLRARPCGEDVCPSMLVPQR